MEVNKSQFSLPPLSSVQVSSVPFVPFEGIESDLTELPEEQAFVHAGPRVLEEVFVIPGEEHLFNYDAGQYSSGSLEQDRQITAPDFSWSDRAAGADLKPGSSPSSSVRKTIARSLEYEGSPAPIGPAMLNECEPERAGPNVLTTAEAEHSWLRLHHGQWQRKVLINNFTNGEKFSRFIYT